MLELQTIIPIQNHSVFVHIKYIDLCNKGSNV